MEITKITQITLGDATATITPTDNGVTIEILEYRNYNTPNETLVGITLEVPAKDYQTFVAALAAMLREVK